MLKKKRRDFKERDEWEREELLSEMWCDVCGSGDIEVENPCEYEIKGVVYLEGTCTRCGEPVVTRIDEELVRD